jgi:Alginate lyase
MKYFLLFFIFAGHEAEAQYVGLGDAEVRSLRGNLRSPGADASLLKLYGAQRTLADQALMDAPHPIDTIRSEGLLQGDPKKTATQSALKDMGKMYALALMYKLDRDTACLIQLDRYFHAWAETDKPRGDPIDDTNLDPVIEAYDMVKNDVPARTERVVRDWLRATADAEITAVYNRPNRATSCNNWHSHRLKIIGEIGFAIGDTAFEGYAIRGFEAQIGRNLRPDGPSEDFVTRDALHYHVYDLEPLLQLAILLKRATGVDYYSWVSPAGSSIRKSVVWLLPFVTGEKTHAEFVNSTVAFDRQRAANGEAAYKAGSVWEVKNGVRTVVLAGYFLGPGLMDTARKAAETDDRYISWESVVVALESGDAGPGHN